MKIKLKQVKIPKTKLYSYTDWTSEKDGKCFEINTVDSSDEFYIKRLKKDLGKINMSVYFGTDSGFAAWCKTL